MLSTTDFTQIYSEKLYEEGKSITAIVDKIMIFPLDPAEGILDYFAKCLMLEHI